MSVNELHSWTGFVFGSLLFVVFLTGTLTVFDNEITDWMQQPEHLRLSSKARGGEQPSAPRPELVSHRIDNGEDDPVRRPPVVKVKIQKYRTFSGQTIDPRTGDIVTYRDTHGGDFFYHFHHGLLLGSPGAWIVGTAAIGMLVTLVTGVGIHRRGVKDVLVFRSWSTHPRASLDAHNLTGILALPFHLMITFTGLMMFWSIYMPTDVQFLSAGDRTLSLLSDLHFAQFGGAVMRWLYFLMGLMASMLIATGLVLWINKRRKYHAERSSTAAYRVIEVLTVVTVAGLLVAIAAYFWANRVLPLALRDRSLWETRCFFLLWCGSLAHGLLRMGSIFAWRDQLYTAAVLFGLLPVLNGLMTNSYLFVTVPKGEWAIAAFDLTALTAGILLAWTAHRIGKAAHETSSGQAVR
jgi:uncharacterized iron-regulated membrane protein